MDNEKTQTDQFCWLNQKFLDPPYRSSFTTYGQIFGDDEQERLLKYVKSRNHTLSFLCNRDAGDGWFEERIGNLKIDKFPVTYTAGRRKKTDEAVASVETAETTTEEKSE